MAAKNCLMQGYPIREAIISALPVCDEFIVLEGYSTDGTFELISTIEDSRIKVFQNEWGEAGHSAEPIRKAINKARERVTGDYIFQVDANQITPPESAHLIRYLPQYFP